MDHRTRRTPARFLAPLALIAVLVVFFAIVSGSGGNGGSGAGDGSSSATTTATTTTTKSSKKKSSTTKSTSKKTASGSATYTVQVGDTLGGIADKTGVPLARIQTLNPAVDPHAMVAGQKIKLR